LGAEGPEGDKGAGVGSRRWAAARGRGGAAVLGRRGVETGLGGGVEWRSAFRPHAARGTLTPGEIERGALPGEAACSTQRGGIEPLETERERRIGDDRRLCCPVLRVRECWRWAA